MLLWRIFPNAPGDVDRWQYFAHEQPHSALPAERLDATADGLDPSGLETMKSVTGLRPFLAMVACAGVLSGCGAAVAPRAVSGGASEPSTPTAASSSPTTGPVATEATAAAQAAAAAAAVAKQAADAAAAQAVPTAPPAPAAPPASIVVFANCAQLNGVYPHGVGRPGAVDQVSGGSAGVTTFDRDAAVYGANTGRDRDKDGVACEKK